jgi:hypothetical protein
MDIQEAPHGLIGVETCGERVVVTGPTIPRMKALLEEKIVVDNWKVSI